MMTEEEWEAENPCFAEQIHGYLLASIGLRQEAQRYSVHSDSRRILQDASDELLAAWRTSDWQCADVAVVEAISRVNREQPGRWPEATDDIDLTLPIMLGGRWIAEQISDIGLTPPDGFRAAAATLERSCTARLNALTLPPTAALPEKFFSHYIFVLAADVQDLVSELIAWPQGQWILRLITGVTVTDD